MSYVWIKPACSAPPASSVCGLSPAALKVLAALRVTYSPETSLKYAHLTQVSETLPPVTSNSYMHIRPETSRQSTQITFESHNEAVNDNNFNFLPMRREEGKDLHTNTRASSPFSLDENDDLFTNFAISGIESTSNWNNSIRMYTSNSNLTEQSVTLEDVTNKTNVASTSCKKESHPIDFDRLESFEFDEEDTIISQDTFAGEDHSVLIEMHGQCISEKTTSPGKSSCDISLTQDPINKSTEDFCSFRNESFAKVTDCHTMLDLLSDENPAQNKHQLQDEDSDGLICSPIFIESSQNSFSSDFRNLETLSQKNPSDYLGTSLERAMLPLHAVFSDDFHHQMEYSKTDYSADFPHLQTTSPKNPSQNLSTSFEKAESPFLATLSNDFTSEEMLNKIHENNQLLVDAVTNGKVDERCKDMITVPSGSAEKQLINSSVSEEIQPQITKSQNKTENTKKGSLPPDPKVSSDKWLSKPKGNITWKKCGESSKENVQKTKGPLKKRIKFQPPLLSQTKPQEEAGVIKELDDCIAQELSAKIISTQLIEITMTIMYKDGFCQLNKPQSSGICLPSGLLIRLLWPTGEQCLHLRLENKVLNRPLLQAIYSTPCRKISYEAQEMFMFLIDKMDLTHEEAKTKFLVLDPLIACWMLQSDNPPQTFIDIVKFLQIPVDMNCGKHELLSILSLSTEYAYRKLNLQQLWKLFLYTEMRITPILACMELRGIRVDANLLRNMAKILENRLEFLQKEAYNAAGKPFQLTSPQQLRGILYDELKLDTKCNITVKGTEKRGDKSTSESMLHLLKNIHPLPGIVLEFRHLHKLKSTYVDAMLSHLIGEFLYTTWEQTSAATGRIASSNPNMQAVPKQPVSIKNEHELFLRSPYVARPGCSFIAADFQHIELRVFAHLSNDPFLINALSKSTDIFRELARLWLRRESVNTVSNDDREKTKRVVYAIMYGAGSSKLSEFLHVDKKEASEIFSSFKEMFPGMHKFSLHVTNQCRKQGYITTESGRRRWLPHITSPNTGLKLYAERQAVNFLVQGTAADLCKSAMVKSEESLAKHPELSAQLLLQIHDELLWEVPDIHIHAVADVVKQAMEAAANISPNLAKFSVPLPVVVTQGKSWANMQPVHQTTLGSFTQSL